MVKIPIYIDNITIRRYTDLGDRMNGINLNKPILYRSASLRYFKEGEHHVSRYCRYAVLQLVFDGVLRFTEDGAAYEIHPGEYHIQRQDSVQLGELPSDAPKYLYVHFLAEWTDSGMVLPADGVFEYAKLKVLMEELDALAHSDAPYIVRTAKFYELLSRLYQTNPAEKSLADKVADYIAMECCGSIDLEMICDKFHFSKNHIINTFKRAYGVTPITYMNQLRLQKARYLIEVTSDPLESIAVQCGFHNYSHFYKLFCRENGCSPVAWRERKRIG